MAHTAIVSTDAEPIIVYPHFMPTHTIFMEGCLNEYYWGVDGLNKTFKI